MIKFKIYRIFALLILLASPCNSWGAGERITLYSEDKLVASETTSSERYARSLAISGDLVVAGNILDDAPNINTGSAFVYRYKNNIWSQETKLTASDGASFDEFGSAVSASENVILIGANMDSDKGSDSGSAYFFRFNSGEWVEETKVTASDGSTGDGFGGAVSISGNVAVVGAYKNDDSGAAYIFRHNGSVWEEEAKLTASDAAASDWYSRGAVAIYNDLAIVGAYGNDDAGRNSGSAYIYRYNGSSWVEEAKLTAPDAAADAQFGYRVALSANTAVISATRDSGKAYEAGAVYVFKFTGSAWVYDQKLFASDGASFDRFGSALSYEGYKLVVGYDRPSGNGAAYVFRLEGSSFIEEVKLLAADGESGDRFGSSVAVSGDNIVSSAYADDDNGTNAGAIYFLSCDENGVYIDESLQSNDRIAHIAYYDSEGDELADASIQADPDSKFSMVQDNGNYYLVVGNGAIFDYAASTEHSVTIGIVDSANHTFSETFTVFIRNTDFVVANDDEYLVSEDGILSIEPSFGILENDQDSSNTALSATVNSHPVHGSLNFNSDGSFEYTPVPDYNGADQFGYTVTNLVSESDSAVVTINVTAVNDPPTDILMDDYIEMKLISPDPYINRDEMGNSVAVSNEVALVAAYQDSIYPDGYTSGSVYLYRYTANAWLLEAKLIPSNAANGFLFGYDVSLDEEVAAISSPHYREFSPDRIYGYVYVYRYNGTAWVEESIIQPTDLNGEDLFGNSVSIDGNVLAAGSHRDSDQAMNAGSVYVYRYNGSSWVQDSKLVASDGEAGDLFGESVVVESNVLVVGAPGHGIEGTAGSAGAVYVFRYDGNSWVEEQKLSASDGGGAFGGSVSICGDVIMIGAKSSQGNNGAAYVFRYDGSAWVEEQILTPSDTGINDWFGSDVSLEEDVALIGKVYDDELADNAGAAYIFKYDGNIWTEDKKLTAFDGAYTDLYGQSVALSGETAMVGAPHADHRGVHDNPGAAYIYNISKNDIMSMSESLIQNDLVTTFSTEDIDSDSFTYTLISDTSGAFQMVGNQLRIANTSNLDFEEITSHKITVEVSDGYDESISKSFTIHLIDVVGEETESQASYVEWRDSQFARNTIGSGLQEDYDRDSVINIMEYALGTDPSSSSDSGMQNITVNGDTVDFSFNRNTADALYWVQSSTDLKNWNDEVLNPGNVGETVTVPVDRPLEGQLFIRLNVDLP